MRQKNNPSEVNLESETLGSKSMGLMYLFSLATIFLILTPRWYEYIILFIVDVVAFQVTLKPFRGFVWHLYPAWKRIYPRFVPANVQNSNTTERVELIEALFGFPGKFTQWSVLFSFPKVIPGTLIVLFTWKYERSLTEQLILFVSLCFLNFLIFGSMMYVSAQKICTQVLRNLHDQQNWQAAFREYAIPPQGKYDAKKEILLLFLPSVFVIIFQVTFLWIRKDLTPSHAAFLIGFIGFFSLFLFGWLLYQWREYLVGGLDQIFKQMTSNPEHPGSTEILEHGISYHTYPLLAVFDRTFNDLFERITRSERELSMLILSEGEKARFKALGEIAASVVHDLSNPVHTLLFCIQQIEENPARAQDPEYRQRLNANILACQRLVQSLKDSIRDERKAEKRLVLLDIQKSVLEVLRTQFLQDWFKTIHFQVEEKAHHLKFKIPNPELCQILDNLYRNSLKNFQEHNNTNPEISLNTHSIMNGYATLLIRDNGSGLTKARFDELTGYGFMTPSALSQGRRKGIGLKLIRRLIEQFDGKLEVSDSPDRPGTCFQLTLPIMEEAMHE